MRVGLVIMDENPADALKIVRAAERAGVHSLWTIDYYNRSSLARAAAFAAVSETAIVGTAGYLRDTACPLLARGAARAGRDAARLRMTTQIVAAASSDPRAARRDAAAQVGFYSTPKGYDLLFPDGQFAAERAAAREALARGDVPGVIAAGNAMVEERAVFGTLEDVAGQLRRYADVIDWAILYPPHFGVDPERIHANELSLIEVASGWTPLRTQPKRIQVVTLDLIDPGQQGVEVPGHAEMAAR
jgi:alkanesulfonate monooxygenase SsuD/methylene tetrahydromethanopterin reductase-like flavin-dependent oxidoreductase (luciferase family)